MSRAGDCDVDEDGSRLVTMATGMAKPTTSASAAMGTATIGRVYQTMVLWYVVWSNEGLGKVIASWFVREISINSKLEKCGFWNPKPGYHNPYGSQVELDPVALYR
jgi:hypothetical protein